MAIGDAYATAVEYRVVVEMDSSANDTVIGRDLLAVSRLIDWKLERPMGFNKDATATVRVYNPSPSIGPYCRLIIDDLVTLTSIAIDTGRDDTFATTLVTSDYELLDRNATLGPEARPYHTVELTEWGSRSLFIPGERVRVTGVHGWPSVPNAIKSATIELTRIFRIESPRATSSVNEMSQVIATSRVAQGIVDQLLERYADRDRIAL